MDFIKIEIDKDKCRGCEICIAICPEIFKSSNKGGFVELASTIVGDGLVDKCIMASESCPAVAINLTPPNLWDDAVGQ